MACGVVLESEQVNVFAEQTCHEYGKGGGRSSAMWVRVPRKASRFKL
jgi:hypothetical protein